jgi:hypothetical protein
MNKNEMILLAISSLRPSGWSLVGYEIQDIIYDEGIEPITQSELDAELKVIESKLQAEAEAKAAEKAALLDRLGITEEEAKLLLA